MLVVLVGGGVAGGLLVLLAFPNTSLAPWPVLVAGASVVLVITLRTARRLQPRG